MFFVAASSPYVGLLNVSETEALNSEIFENKIFENSASVRVSKPQKVTVDYSVAQHLPWLSAFYSVSKYANKAKEILPVISGIKELFAKHEYSVVDDILLELEINKLSHTAMIAFISAAYPARDKLYAWSLAVGKVKAALSKDGLNPDDILKGLI